MGTLENAAMLAREADEHVDKIVGLFPDNEAFVIGSNGKAYIEADAINLINSAIADAARNSTDRGAILLKAGYLYGALVARSKGSSMTEAMKKMI